MRTYILSFLFFITCIVCWAFNAQSQVMMCSPMPQCPYVTNGTTTTIASCAVQLCPMEKRHRVMKVFYSLLGVRLDTTAHEYGWAVLGNATTDLNECRGWIKHQHAVIFPQYFCIAEWKWVP